MNKPDVYILEAQSLTALTTARAISSDYTPIAIYIEGSESNVSLQSTVWKKKIGVKALDAGLIPVLQSIGSHSGPKAVLITATDDGVLFLSKFHDQLKNLFILPLPDLETVNLLMDKSKFYQWAEEQDLPIINTVLCESAEEILSNLKSFELPFIIKPKVREAIWNTRFPVDKILFVESEGAREKLVGNYLELFSGIDGIIIQKYISGGDDQIFFVLLAHDLQGNLIVQFAGQKLGQWPPRGGSTMVCVPYQSEEVLRVTNRIFSKLHMCGLASMEYKKCADTGKYYIIEPTVGRCDHQSLIAEYSGLPLVKLFLDRLVLGAKKRELNSTKARIWVDEVAFLRLIKLDGRSAINLLKKIGFHNFGRIRPLLFRFSDPKPWVKAIALLLRIGKRAAPKSKNYSIKPISSDQFQKMSAEWDALLKDSDSNPLFMSWAWQINWWNTWSAPLSLIDYFHGVYCDEKLVGLLPLFRLAKRRFGRTEIHYVGNVWGVAPTVRSEYISSILHVDHAENIQLLISDWIKNHSMFSCFVLPDSPRKYLDAQWYVLKKLESGYRVNVSCNFESYKDSLSQSSRLRIFNRMEYLLTHYDQVEFFDYILDEPSLDQFFNSLNGFHKMRWGKPCFSDSALEFHKKFILTATNTSPKLCGLKIDGSLVSVSYNLLVDGTLYNIQSGYLENFDKKVSLGLIHFGHLLDVAFKSPSVKYYDFLAGKGKTSDYKASFLGETIEFRTFYIFTNPVALWIYSIKSFLKSAISIWKN